MNIICPKPPSLCNDPADPLANISSEAPDTIDRIGWGYGEGWGFAFGGSGGVTPYPADYVPPIDGGGIGSDPSTPPLGSQWISNWCNGSCVSDVSQEEADLCAYNEEIECQSLEWPETVPDPNDPDGPPITQPRTIYWNAQQQCTVFCPDGLPFTYTVAPHQVSAFSQAQANALAFSRACSLAALYKVCLGSLSLSHACLNESFAATIACSTRFPPVSFTPTSGSLPPGILEASSAKVYLLNGVPTTAGNYTFILTATDSRGNGMSKTYTITVTGIATSSLPSGVPNTPYSELLVAAGSPPSPVTWSVFAGSLPPGLSLSSTGTISGTVGPSASGSYSFTALMCDGSGFCCQKQLSISIISCPASAGWTTILDSVTGTATGSNSFQPCSVTADANCPGTANTEGGVNFYKYFDITNTTLLPFSVRFTGTVHGIASGNPGVERTVVSESVTVEWEDLTVPANGSTNLYLHNGVAEGGPAFSWNENISVPTTDVLVPVGHTIRIRVWHRCVLSGTFFDSPDGSASLTCALTIAQV